MRGQPERDAYEVDDVIDYSKHGVKPMGPHDPPRAVGRDNPRHDMLTRKRLDAPRRKGEDEDDHRRWNDLQATAEEYAADDNRRMFFPPPVDPGPVRDWLGRSTRRVRRAR